MTREGSRSIRRSVSYLRRPRHGQGHVDEQRVSQVDAGKGGDQAPSLREASAFNINSNTNPPRSAFNTSTNPPRASVLTNPPRGLPLESPRTPTTRGAPRMRRSRVTPRVLLSCRQQEAREE